MGAAHALDDQDMPMPGPLRPTGLHVYRPRVYMPWARSRSLGTRPLTAAERAELDEAYAGFEVEGLRRPRTRAECPSGPCPWATCRWNLLTWVEERFGAVKETHPGRDFDELEETCALRAADAVAGEGVPMSFDRLGALNNVRVEWVTSLFEKALAKIAPELARIQAENDSLGGPQP